jgi:lysophospholipase L1-like esterase
MNTTRRLILLLWLFSSAVSWAQNPAITPQPRVTPTNWIERHEGFVAEARKGGIDLVFMGDSITDAWRTTGKAVWDTYYLPRNAVNFGISGDRTQHLLWRIQEGELDGLKPKVVVLMIGTNNSNTDSADQIAEGVEAVVSAIRGKCPDAKVLLLAIFPRNKPTDIPEQLEAIRLVNQRIAKLDDGAKVRFLDIGAKFLAPDGTLPAETMPDFLHLSPRGYQIWADAIEATLAGMMK